MLAIDNSLQKISARQKSFHNDAVVSARSNQDVRHGHSDPSRNFTQLL